MPKDDRIIREPLPSELEEAEVDKLTWRDIVEPPDTIMGDGPSLVEPCETMMG